MSTLSEGTHQLVFEDGVNLVHHGERHVVRIHKVLHHCCFLGAVPVYSRCVHVHMKRAGNKKKV